MKTFLIIIYLIILLIFFIRIKKLTKENNELHRVIDDIYKALLPLKKVLEENENKLLKEKVGNNKNEKDI